MKRKLCLILAFCLICVSIFTFSACSPETDDTKIKIGVLFGTTGVGAAKMMADADPRYEFTVYQEPSTLITDFSSGALDMAALSSNAAAQLYQKTKQGAKVLSINTLGVLYVLDSTGTVNSLSDLEGKTIYVPMPNNAPEYMLRHLLSEAGLSDKVTISFKYAAADALSAAVVSGDAPIALLPEPSATATTIKAKAQGKTVKVALDVSALWQQYEESAPTQGCLIATKSFCEEHPLAVKEFLETYEASIAYMKNAENLENAAAMIVEGGLLPSLPVAKAALPRCNIAYLDGAEMKSALSSFLKILFDSDPKSVGGTLPDDGFYYVP